MLRRTLMLGLLGWFCVCGTVAAPLDSLVTERLSLMRAVAAYKWHHQRPIEDRAREQQVLDAAANSGLQHQLNPRTLRPFFTAQIEAAKAIQRYWTEQWRVGVATPPQEAPDLTGTLRPQLLALGDEITRALAAGQRLADAPSVEGLGRASAMQLVKAAAGVSRYPDRLIQVLDTGLLRVGTTGDYPPFSLRDADADPVGIDIDLARDLAASLGVKVRWVATSWPTLMEDLEAGRFDIGMSGVSIALHRARSAWFSMPYHSGGKSVITRCSLGNVQSLEDLDRPEVRFVVNPGGTNERVSRSLLKQASLRIYPDNRSIFTEIVAGRADAMITDRIEVLQQAIEQDALCASLTESTLTRAEKAYLLPKDEALLRYVDTWLRQRLLDGVIAATFERHAPGAHRIPALD